MGVRTKPRPLIGGHQEVKQHITTCLMYPGLHNCSSSTRCASFQTCRLLVVTRTVGSASTVLHGFWRVLTPRHFPDTGVAFSTVSFVVLSWSAVLVQLAGVEAAVRRGGEFAVPLCAPALGGGYC